ncbi:universal stress protein [Acuticoccus sp. M5D2P5]|uniref:universal stress protein n=1 Tax=Acuticoccus kalidii TaxID=2910977 RepID=UPI001F17E8A9|nr:universal stress protein [Acuticoccus kalidii]MCF3935616.1 universal stress protein [Acuticoccus kalidii]
MLRIQKLYKKIVVPVDLEHIDKLSKALDVAANLGKLFEAELIYVGVTPTVPTTVAHNPDEYVAKLKAFTTSESGRRGHPATSKAFTSHDPSIDIDQYLPRAVAEVGGDLVVMASHVPGFFDRFWPSHGENLASHTNASVFLVR